MSAEREQEQSLENTLRVGIESELDGLLSWMQQRESSLSVAESCTGGLLSATITARPGVSSCYKGGIVAYANSVKQQYLGVPESLLHTLGAVSEPVAGAMAQGAREFFNTSYAVSTTGIAGPGGGTADKPVGTVYFAVSGPGLDIRVKKVFKSEERQHIQLESVLFALKFLNRGLQF